MYKWITSHEKQVTGHCTGLVSNISCNFPSNHEYVFFTACLVSACLKLNFLKHNILLPPSSSKFVWAFLNAYHKGIYVSYFYDDILGVGVKRFPIDVCREWICE